MHPNHVCLMQRRAQPPPLLLQLRVRVRVYVWEYGVIAALLTCLGKGLTNFSMGGANRHYVQSNIQTIRWNQVITVC